MSSYFCNASKYTCILKSLHMTLLKNLGGKGNLKDRRTNEGHSIIGLCNLLTRRYILSKRNLSAEEGSEHTETETKPLQEKKTCQEKVAQRIPCNLNHNGLDCNNCSFCGDLAHMGNLGGLSKGTFISSCCACSTIRFIATI